MPTCSQDCYIVNTIYMSLESCYFAAAATLYACWPCAIVTNTAAVQTCLLVECCCKMDACRTVPTQTACLLTSCHSVLHVCWCCSSLSARPAEMVSHYQLCLLVWCLTISRACWCGVHYRPCLLVWYITISHAC